jgi:hypothetical protein
MAGLMTRPIWSRYAGNATDESRASCGRMASAILSVTALRARKPKPAKSRSHAERNPAMVELAKHEREIRRHRSAAHRGNPRRPCSATCGARSSTGRLAGKGRTVWLGRRPSTRPLAQHGRGRLIRPKRAQEKTWWCRSPRTTRPASHSLCVSEKSRRGRSSRVVFLRRAVPSLFGLALRSANTVPIEARHPYSCGHISRNRNKSREFLAYARD